MTSGRKQGNELSIGTISVLRTLVELDQAGAIEIDTFRLGQREQGDNPVANAIDAIRGHTGSIAARRAR